MILQQFYLNCLAHASYLVGDERSRIAAVVDPQRDIDQYLAFASGHDLRIAHVILTHLHADFIAGHLELRDRVGATIYLGAAAKAEYAFTPLADGDRVEFGNVLLQALETPGHTPESISILVFDREHSETEPRAVLTGDTLFVGDVGRPDLRVALGWSAADLGGMLYESLTTKLLPLPDASLVYPAHGAGSLCGKAISKETVSTIGEQRRVNYALQPMTKAAFVDLVTADQPDAPPYFTYDAVLNSKERPTLDEALARELNPMTLDQVLALQQVGGQLLDTRDPAEFADALDDLPTVEGGQRHVEDDQVRMVIVETAQGIGPARGHDGPVPGAAHPQLDERGEVRLVLDDQDRVSHGRSSQPRPRPARAGAGVIAAARGGQAVAEDRRRPGSRRGHRAGPPVAAVRRAPRPAVAR
jgi:glyoxylase-like metal-dependent hydrolase (beta-lactamase superfamily II)